MKPRVDLSSAADQDLVLWALEGHEDAYSEIVRRYGPHVYALIYRIVRRRDLAEDLTQETFARAFRRLESHRREANFAAWIRRIGRNAALSYVRIKQLPTVPLDGSSHAQTSDEIKATAFQVANPTPPPSVDARALRLAIVRALDRMKDADRVCFMLRVFEGRSYEEIARITKLPPGTVKTCLRRAREEIKRRVGPLFDTSLPPG